MAGSYPSRQTCAAAIIVSNTTGPNPTVVGNPLGFSATVTSNGVGDVTVTLSSGYEIDLTNVAPTCTPLGATFLLPVIQHVSDSQWRVRCFDAAGAALEGGFSLVLERKSVG